MTSRHWPSRMSMTSCSVINTSHRIGYEICHHLCKNKQVLQTSINSCQWTQGKVLNRTLGIHTGYHRRGGKQPFHLHYLWYANWLQCTSFCNFKEILSRKINTNIFRVLFCLCKNCIWHSASRTQGSPMAPSLPASSCLAWAPGSPRERYGQQQLPVPAQSNPTTLDMVYFPTMKLLFTRKYPFWFV